MVLRAPLLTSDRAAQSLLAVQVPERFALTGTNAAFPREKGNHATVPIGTGKMEHSDQAYSLRITQIWTARRIRSTQRPPPYGTASWKTIAMRAPRKRSIHNTANTAKEIPRRDQTSAVYCTSTQRPRQA